MKVFIIFNILRRSTNVLFVKILCLKYVLYKHNFCLVIKDCVLWLVGSVCYVHRDISYSILYDLTNNCVVCSVRTITWTLGEPTFFS